MAGVAGAAGVSAGYSAACAWAVGGGSAWCWGDDYNGQLGNGGSDDTASGAVLVATPGGVAWTQVAAHNAQACGLSAAGGAYCWGASAYVGGGPPPLDTSVPVPVAAPAPGPLAWASLSTGCMASTTVAVAAGDASAYGWGARRRRGGPPPRRAHSAAAAAPLSLTRPRPPRPAPPHPASAQGSSTGTCSATAWPPRPTRPHSSPSARACRPAPASRARARRRATPTPASARDPAFLRACNGALKRDLRAHRGPHARRRQGVVSGAALLALLGGAVLERRVPGRRLAHGAQARLLRAPTEREAEDVEKDLASNRMLGAAGIEVLVAAPTFALRRLILSDCDLDTAALVALVNAPWPLAALSRRAGLRRLTVYDCRLSAVGFKVLAEAAWPALTRLSARGAALAFDGPHALGAAAFAGFPALEEPHLPSVALGEAGAALLARRRWPRLRELILFRASLDAAGLAELARAEWPTLDRLNPRWNDFGAPPTLEDARRWASALVELHRRQW